MAQLSRNRTMLVDCQNLPNYVWSSYRIEFCLCLRASAEK
jgi:hypothetical protein